MVKNIAEKGEFNLNIFILHRLRNKFLQLILDLISLDSASWELHQYSRRMYGPMKNPKVETRSWDSNLGPHDRSTSRPRTPHRKRRKCRSPSFSPFPTTYSACFFTNEGIKNSCIVKKVQIKFQSDRAKYPNVGIPVISTPLTIYVVKYIFTSSINRFIRQDHDVKIFLTS